jgi:hypothetical protein
MEAKAYKPPVRELASRIYIELVVRSLDLSGGAAKLPVTAEDLAKLSFQAAEIFQGVEETLNAKNLPKNVGFTLSSSDIEDWSKPK